MLFLGIVLLLSGCNTGEKKDTTTYKMTKEVADASYTDINFKMYKEGRPCTQIKFMCLPESLDKPWQQSVLKDGLDTLEITPEVEKKYALAIQAWNKEYHTYMEKHTRMQQAKK